MTVADHEAETPASQQVRIAEAVRTSMAPVLVAVDFSRNSEAALIWACGYAETIGAPLEILHVVHDPADAPGRYRPNGDDPLEPIPDVARRKLIDFLARIEWDNACRSAVEAAKLICVEGLPASRILDVAQAHGAQLLVLGGPRRNGLAQLVHGSTANQVARQVRLPVTIVRADG